MALPNLPYQNYCRNNISKNYLKFNMEPPAVTSCGVGHPSGLGGGIQHGQSQKRETIPVGFLQIEPQISFNAPNRHFEELPENFLETISPQQHGGHGHGHGHPSMMSNTMNLVGNSHEGVHSTTSPQLASLTTVSMAGGGANGNSGYANLVPMPSSSHYISTLKMESTMDHLAHHSQLHQTNQLDKTTYGNGPAGLLSPLQLDSNRTEPNAMGLLGSVHHHRPNGGSRTSDLLSGIRRNNVSYIKEEINPAEIGYQTTHDYDGTYAIHQPTAQELERMANAETPPALSNVEITSSILASLSRDSPSPSIQHQQSSPQTHFIVHQMPPRQHHHQQQLPPQHVMQQQVTQPPTGGTRSRKSKQNQQQQQQQQQVQAAQRLIAQNSINVDSYDTMEPANPILYPQLNDMNDPLNAEIDDEIYIDTKDLCKRVAYELKQHSIPQAIFAERILCRSQGTLSDLLRNPKPWNRLKSGRETFKRMYNWLQQPLHIRLSILDMYKGPMVSGVIPPPTPAQNSRHHHRRRTSTGDDGQQQKRPRLVFTDIQKRTLQAIFKETQRPSREMQQTIAEHLRLDMSTVSNFFMNARRRSRNGNGMGDEPAPYQQVTAFALKIVRTITPPPDSPPTAQQQQMLTEQHQPSSSTTTTRRTKSSSISYNQSSSAANLSHIEQTVDEVVGRSMAYAKKIQSQYTQPVNQTVMEQPPEWEEEAQNSEFSFANDDAEAATLETADNEEEIIECKNNNQSVAVDEQENSISDDNKPGEFEDEDRKSIERPTKTEEEEQDDDKIASADQDKTDKHDDHDQAEIQYPKIESPLNDAEAPTAPGTPVNQPEEEETEKDQILEKEQEESQPPVEEKNINKEEEGPSSHQEQKSPN